MLLNPPALLPSCRQRASVAGFATIVRCCSATAATGERLPALRLHRKFGHSARQQLADFRSVATDAADHSWRQTIDSTWSGQAPPA
jgi:hypothetical protein